MFDLMGELSLTAKSISDEYASARIHEAHHRCMNALHLFRSLARRRLSEAKSRETREALSYICDLALIVSRLHVTIENFKEDVDLCGHLHECAQLWQRIGNGHIQIVVETNEAVPMTPANATNASLIVHELVLNAMKHAFPAGCRGTILIECKRIDEDEVILTVSDDGVGRSACTQKTSHPKDEAKHGSDFVRAFVAALDGTITRRDQESGGHSVSVRWAR